MTKHTFRMAGTLLLTGVIALAGCSGEDGAAGAAGTQGPPGPVTDTVETCNVCHGKTKTVTGTASHILPFASGTQDNINVAITGVADSGGKLAITFTAANSDGPITTVGTGDIRVYFAEISTVDVAGGNPSNYLNRWPQGYERTGNFDFDAGTAVDNRAYPFGALVHNGAGSYTYTSAADIVDAPTATNVQRIFIRVSKTGQNTGNAIRDFLPAAVGTAVTNARDIVPSATCNRCHIERIADHGHGGGYNLSEACVVCHSPLLDEAFYTNAPHDMQALAFDMPTMIHQIHGAISTVNPWSAVTYPAALNDCVVCHTGGAQSDNFKTNPTALACTGCHTFVKFTDSPGYNAATLACGDAAWVYPNPCNHSPERATTADCSGCHADTDIVGYHDPSINRVHIPTQVNTPEFNVNMTITPPPNGTHYVAGDTLSIAITLTNKSDASAVPSTFYTAAKHTAGTTSATALSNARLYIYGPRTAPKPVLTAGAKVTPIPTQATQLFASPAPTDTNVDTDDTGFKYNVVIPSSGIANGTYFVRFYATNYGYVSDTDYVTDSNAFAVIQIGSATVQQKISGNACVDCHGDHLAPFHDARHGVKFDTDECNSCHDLSGNHAAPLAGRVHAIHASSAIGDPLFPDEALSWAEVEYPVGSKSGGIYRCATCHDSGNLQFKEPPSTSQSLCWGCHADNILSADHMRQNGGDL